MTSYDEVKAAAKAAHDARVFAEVACETARVRIAEAADLCQQYTREFFAQHPTAAPVEEPNAP